MPIRPLPIQSCRAGGCKDPKFVAFNSYIQPQTTRVERQVAIINSSKPKRLGCLPSGTTTELDASGNKVTVPSGCPRLDSFTVYTPPQHVNGFGRYRNMSGCLSNPQKGGLVVSNFH